jgi:hypothetical protein
MTPARPRATILARATAAGAVVARAIAAGAVVARAMAVGAVLLLAACGGGGGDPAPAPEDRPPAQRSTRAPDAPSDEAQLRALVLDRAAALEGGDPGAYAASAAGAQRARDRRAARRAARLGVRAVQLEPEEIEVHGRRAEVAVSGEYELESVRGSYRVSHRIVAVRSGEGWRVRAVSGGRGRPPWEVAAFGERRSRHFVVLAPPEVPVDELFQALEAGYAQIRSQLRRGSLRRRYLVVVAGDARQANRLTTAIRGVGTLAAIADAVIREQGPERRVSRVVSLRLLVVWPRFSLLEAAGRQRVIAHELTHVALAGSTSGRTPAWLVEGIALYVSRDRRTAPPGADLGALSRPDAIAGLSGDAQADAYSASSAAAFAIVDRFGRGRLLALYDAFNDPVLEGDPGRRLVDRALRRELGITLRELEADLG